MIEELKNLKRKWTNILDRINDKVLSSTKKNSSKVVYRFAMGMNQSLQKLICDQIFEI